MQLLVDNCMAVTEAGWKLEGSAYQVWRVVLNYTRGAVAAQDTKGIRRLAIDETSKANGFPVVTSDTSNFSFGGKTQLYDEPFFDNPLSRSQI